ncbi:hypothetical protein ACKKBF_B01385 [Auxenochlorella protothecoides x Auxenochlorella symbiontica]
MAKRIGARANGHQHRTSKPLTVFVKAVMSAFSMVSLHFGAKTANSSSNASSNASTPASCSKGENSLAETPKSLSSSESSAPATPTLASPATPYPYLAASNPASPAPAASTPASPAPATSIPASPAPATSTPASPAPATSTPASPAPATSTPASPAPATSIPASPAPATSIPAPFTPIHTGDVAITPPLRHQRRNSVSCDEALFTPGCPAGYLALMEEPTPSLVPPSPRAATPFEVNLPEDLYGFANAETTSSTSPHSLESTDSYSAPSYAPTILTTPSEVDSDADEAWMSGFAAGIADTTAYLLKGSCAEREQKLVARVAELNACQHQYQIELMQAMDIQAEVQQWENYLQDLLAQAACLFPDGEEGALQAALHIFNSHEAKEVELRNASIYHFEEVAA